MMKLENYKIQKASEHTDTEADEKGTCLLLALARAQKQPLSLKVVSSGLFSIEQVFSLHEFLEKAYK